MNYKILIIVCLSILFSCSGNSNVNSQTTADNFLGSYTDGFNTLIEVKKEYDKYFLEPSFERGIFLIDTIKKEYLISTEIFSGTKDTIRFKKNANQQIVEIIRRGKTLNKLKPNKPTPIEVLVTGKNREAKSLYLKNQDKFNSQQLLKAGIFMFFNMPSKAKVTEGIFEIVNEINPKSSECAYYLGRSYLVNKKREKAKEAFQKALKLGSDEKATINKYLNFLNNELQCSKHPSIDFNKLFAKPEDTEINKVMKDWKSRDLNPNEFNVVLDTLFADNGFKGKLQILSYSINNKKNYGALFIPNYNTTEKLPAIVEAKGINYRYSGLNVSYRPKMSPYLKEKANKFIYIVPAVKGELMTYSGYNFKGDGLPNDGWDGATDDYLTFLNVSIKHLNNKIDTQRIIAFGDSRGGTVAMLAAIRDKRINTVINWAGPVDWVNHMNGSDGLTLKEQVIDGLNNNIKPISGTPGQFIDWYFHQNATIKNEVIRKKIISSSPLYFIKHLPDNILIHYGKEDKQVPIQNGYTLANELQKLNRPTMNFKYFFHENIGHNLNPYEAIRETRKFINELYFK